MDLEEEFKKLMQKNIDEVKNRTDLTVTEQADLIVAIYSRMSPPKDTGWSSSTQDCIDAGTVLPPDCPDGHTYDCGWSSSMGYHCS